MRHLLSVVLALGSLGSVCGTCQKGVMKFDGFPDQRPKEVSSNKPKGDNFAVFNQKVVIKRVLSRKALFSYTIY